MKGKTPKRTGAARFGDVLQNFTSNQLAWIGAVAMIFNEAEASLHDVVAAGIDMPGNPYDLTYRINSLDSLREIAWLSAPHLGLPPAVVDMIEKTLVNQGFAFLKPYRDCLIHARMFDVATDVGIGPIKKGRFDYILMTEDALENLFIRLQCVQKELEEIALIIPPARRLHKSPAPSDRHKERLEQAIRDGSFQVQLYQNRRQSLPPLPKLPEQPGIFSLKRTPTGRKPPGA